MKAIISIRINTVVCYYGKDRIKDGRIRMNRYKKAKKWDYWALQSR